MCIPRFIWNSEKLLQSHVIMTSCLMSTSGRGCHCQKNLSTRFGRWLQVFLSPQFCKVLFIQPKSRTKKFCNTWSEKWYSKTKKSRKSKVETSYLWVTLFKVPEKPQRTQVPFGLESAFEYGAVFAKGDWSFQIMTSKCLIAKNNPSNQLHLYMFICGSKIHCSNRANTLKTTKSRSNLGVEVFPETNLAK